MAYERTEPRESSDSSETALHAGHLARLKREHEAALAREIAEQEAATTKAGHKSAAIRRQVGSWLLVAIGAYRLARIPDDGNPKWWIGCLVLGAAIMSIEQALTAMGKR